ncbi:ribose 5-phosphate isomerase B [Campylobacter geochelonis]|uniref:Ribose 5-phosphate isomerase B n=1 Tax=Campylobacter geochelonis TaxID=1780362 RepID=A0A128ELJ0_9BACT|nr:ribose 5-phosphate isomerase B [Campylobacter geochelonis]QKF71642.1 allose-6-phosphate isomerase / ribose-5-phosphate isomerase B [Campylobacter geochelonis]CZE48369.1 ribose 5-phosphate isomerase B [Campylobacter geochelonis]CZE49381.1 ribose 5-phosphate isomerase B [Campylobacter geochelonis]CZE51550.1 ribose 5-phosphate isomerase B [Campylobacter geochelonis]
MNIKRIYIASDHAGFLVKDESKKLLLDLGFEVVDLGANSAEVSVDYPDFAQILCQKVANEDEAYGVLICGTGIGISIAANRNPDIRCALCHDTFTATMAREHNDANVLAYGARVVGMGVVQEMLKAFFSTEFAGGRHQKRVDKLGCCC